MEKTPPTILCVDDERNQLVLRKSMLERAGYRVLTAELPAQAMEVMGSDTVDLVILDYYMPGMNGLALAREILHQKKLPVVILSAYAELPAESIGTADTWIMKGSASEELLRKIAELLSRGSALADQSQKRSEA